MSPVPPIEPFCKVSPKVYSYITPEIKRHEGWSKIGYTEKDVKERIDEQTHTADVLWELEWAEDAKFIDDNKPFKDYDFHRYLIKNDIEKMGDKNNEWFHVVKPRSHELFDEFRKSHGILSCLDISDYQLRDEQNQAVAGANDYFNTNTNGEFLWNAKPRFGKTLSAYDLCKRLSAKNVLIVTNRPVIANSWYEDYCKFLGEQSGYKFVTEVDSLCNEKYVLSRKDFDHYLEKNPDAKCIEFMSLQNLKGSKYVGGQYDKLRYVFNINWDLLIIDEAHEGVDTYRADKMFEHVMRKCTLHLSGTPFKAIANEKFAKDAIYNWTYVDEQRAKRKYEADPSVDNPYGALPRLSMYTYQMSSIVEDLLRSGIEIDGKVEDYAFDLNEFFATKKNGTFIHDDAVDKFLDALSTQEKFPFSTEELRNELRHTLWLLNRVDSAKALQRKLKAHKIFGEPNYKVILAAGDGISEDDEKANTDSFAKVTDAIKKYDRTITLSVGQLTTGITIPEWSAVLMLSNIRSAAFYMQAAFRAQNPCLISSEDNFYRKENAYVFDFDPARTLKIFESFANDLIPTTSSGRGDEKSHRENISALLNFFPVIGEDENGKMVELDAEKVLTIPAKIRSKEVVRKGFMSNFLFKNIGNIFNSPPEVQSVLQKLKPYKEPEGVLTGGVDLDDEGNVVVSKERVIGLSQDIFGDKIYELNPEVLEPLFEHSEDPKGEQYKSRLDALVGIVNENILAPLMEDVKETYGTQMRPSTVKQCERHLRNKIEDATRATLDDIVIATNNIQKDREEELSKAGTVSERKAVNKKYDALQSQKITEIKESYVDKVEEIKQDSKEFIVETVETDKLNRSKKEVEDKWRDSLRGFTRSIPSFLMAYGSDREITLANLDTVVPADVFKAVTDITVEEFRCLRDGCTIVNEDTGESEFVKTEFFDQTVFDDSVKEFLALKNKLADYFDEGSTGDIFDYIPPQKTYQVFTPKEVVKSMVDKLEQDNPGCFDDPDKTFADFYMKSGLYLAEIVKRLYRSSQLKKLFPDEKDRLNHIFSKQVYGLAPTEIIYRIVLSFLLGFSDEITIEKHNIKLCDALPYAKNGTLETKLKEVFDLE